MTQLASRARLLDLLVSRATEGVSHSEISEISQLGPLHPDLSPDHFDEAASAIALTEPTDNVDMPKELQSLVLSQAVVALEGLRGSDPTPLPADTQEQAARAKRERIVDRVAPPNEATGRLHSSGQQQQDGKPNVVGSGPALSANSLTTPPSAEETRPAPAPHGASLGESEDAQETLELQPEDLATASLLPSLPEAEGGSIKLKHQASKPELTSLAPPRLSSAPLPSIKEEEGPFLSDVKDETLDDVLAAAAKEPVAERVSPTPVPAYRPEGDFPRAAQSSSEGLPAWTGWAAAAAILLLALGRVRPRLTGVSPVESEVVASEPVAVELPPALSSLPQTFTLDFGATEDPAALGVTGQVIWNTAEQRGEMQFTGLVPNDPTVYQYQLWIFDALQDERYPIDGGVFDIPAEGTVTIAIDPKIEVREPTLFAVTIEEPGGVVVSSRERIVLAAAV